MRVDLIKLFNFSCHDVKIRIWAVFLFSSQIYGFNLYKRLPYYYYYYFFIPTDLFFSSVMLLETSVHLGAFILSR